MRYQSNRPKRQFLAGVACPSCKALDKVVQIQLYQPEYDEYIECTACGYTERRPTPDEIVDIQQSNHQETVHYETVHPGAVGDDSAGIVRFK